MAMSNEKFVEGVEMMIREYRKFENPTLANAQNVIQFIEIGLMLVGREKSLESFVEDINKMLDAKPLFEDTAAQEADVIDLADFRAKGGLLN